MANMTLFAVVASMTRMTVWVSGSWRARASIRGPATPRRRRRGGRAWHPADPGHSAPALLVPALLQPVPMVSERLGMFLAPRVVAWHPGGHRAPPSILTSASWEDVAWPSLSHSANRKLAHGRASHPDHDLPSGVTCLQVPHRLGGLTK